MNLHDVHLSGFVYNSKYFAKLKISFFCSTGNIILKGIHKPGMKILLCIDGKSAACFYKKCIGICIQPRSTKEEYHDRVDIDQIH